MDSALDDVEFLARSAHRVATLDALSEGPHDRAALRDAIGASDPTIGRILGDFGERGWTRREGDAYVLTASGSYVARHFATLLDHVRSERRLRDAWKWLPDDLDGFDLDLVTDAVVTTIEPGDPYAPANRCASFYPGTTRLRGFDAALTSPHNFETLHRLVVDGMETEFVLSRAVAAHIRRAYPERERRVRESGHLELWLNDDLPTARLTIFDDRVGVGGYDPDTGVLAVYVDTDDPAVREWAVSTFEAVRREATPAPPGRPTS